MRFVPLLVVFVFVLFELGCDRGGECDSEECCEISLDECDERCLESCVEACGDDECVDLCYVIRADCMDECEENFLSCLDEFCGDNCHWWD